MELPRRNRGDELLKPGELAALRARFRRLAPSHNLTAVVVCAFDHRTRMLPFIFADTRMAPAGVRAVGSALVDSGIDKVRIVLQQWNRFFKPSRMRLDGRIPDLFMVSSMGLHSDEAMRLIRDARTIDPAHRPLIIAGGPHAVYQPYEMFSGNPADPNGPDVVVTGEEFVLLSLLEILLSLRAAGEAMRSVFLRARDSGALDEIPGLVYAQGTRDGVAEELIDTGIQRLVGDLDELPDPVLGYRLLEAPSRGTRLALHALPPQRVRHLTPLSSLVLTFGCKFACPYCPIPAYNQRQHRVKSGGRILQDMYRLNKEYGLGVFFGADDNFFNNKTRTLEIIQLLASAKIDGLRLRKKVRWGTEVTVHDTLQMKDHLKLAHEAGCRALWLGVEDMTAKLVNKGQSVNKTTEAFHSLRSAGICPMPMMMHHDSQPLYSPGSNYGLINQINILRKAGAASMQVLMISPSTGTKLYEPTYADGQVFQSVGGKRLAAYMFDGNHVIASKAKHPWQKQINMLLGYLFFYNPFWVVWMLLHKRTKVINKALCIQFAGMAGLIYTVRGTFTWTLRLMFGRIKRCYAPPQNSIPVRTLHGPPSPHGVSEMPDQSGAPTGVSVQLNLPPRRREPAAV
jgi:radical SAM superfamily enzyme YgiQ (UPF0313 family)